MPKLIASWDDGTIADLKMADLMSKYQIETIFYWPTYISQIKKFAVTSSWLNPEQCQNIAKSFEIGSHSVSDKPMKKMTLPQITREIYESRKYLQDLTGQSINSFSYPKNSLSTLIKALIKGAEYTSARNLVIGNIQGTKDIHDIHCSVQIGIDRIEYRNLSWEKYADKLLSKCNDNSVFYIFGNSWDVESYNDWDNLETLIKKILGK
jgi:peptidoglycan/xylan/chitin deacetylase (PgdA/CDA1 family)